LDDATPGSVSLTGMSSQGNTFALNASTWTIASGAGDANPYFLIQGLDFSQPWYVEGSAVLSFAGTTTRERPAINWKFTESMGSYAGQTLTNAAPVPEPGSLLLYSAALGVLGLARRRVHQG
jgi:hypothetical protein